MVVYIAKIGSFKILRSQNYKDCSLQKKKTLKVLINLKLKNKYDAFLHIKFLFSLRKEISILKQGIIHWKKITSN